MSIVQPVAVASDRVMACLVAGLELEFGQGAGEALAARFLEAEEIDIHWDARASERWLGSYAGAEDNPDLDRIAATGLLDGHWFVAIFIVDGEGDAHGLLSCRTLASKEEADRVFALAR